MVESALYPTSPWAVSKAEVEEAMEAVGEYYNAPDIAALAEGLVLVLWRDACGASEDWRPLPTEEPGPGYCLSVGWLAVDGADRKVIVPHKTVLGPGEEMVEGCGNMTIEKPQIVGIWPLHLGPVEDSGVASPSAQASKYHFDTSDDAELQRALINKIKLSDTDYDSDSGVEYWT